MSNLIGITERGDAGLDTSWLKWVLESKPAILISKRPNVLFEILRNFKNTNVIVHTTITGFGSTILEPNVPCADYTIASYYKLVGLLGEDRVVLRIDPVIPTEKGLETAKSIVAKSLNTRIRISFIDNYDHLKERFRQNDIDQLPWDSFHAPLELRKKAWEELGKPEICGEPDMPCTGCVSAKDCEVLGVIPIEKEKGQRFFCKCLANKKELLMNCERCPHNCIYCYWRG